MQKIVHLCSENIQTKEHRNKTKDQTVKTNHKMIKSGIWIIQEWIFKFNQCFDEEHLKNGLLADDSWSINDISTL